MVRFEWDQEKAASNLEKHGVSFEEASSIFGDPLGTTVRDESHSLDEPRFLTTGFSSASRVLIVWHTERDNGIRIIGARAATTKERRVYESEE